MNESHLGAENESTTRRSPFVFGISGHRDVRPEDLAELANRLQLVFDHFRLAHPAASFELLSPLAEGADRIAAEVALRSGIRVVVPLPMPQAEYERDFITPKSLDEFRRLLAASDTHFEVRDPEPQSDRRSEKYAAVGDYIARRSHVLILLWDGQDNKKIGGTSWVKKRREHWMTLSKSERGAPPIFGYVGTIHIVTPRVANAQRHPMIEIIGELPPAGGTQTDERSKL
ncbi:MAG TPA: hypothetical protein VH188_07865 [Chthoniobacterales bacterium]|jgi:hypothetical protein|nr:hypothetical protein [Chthoniobacterales bacterium]